jgi:hypothetical protein
VRSVIKQHIQLDDYRKVLFEKCVVRRNMKTFATERHQVYTREVNKISLSGDDHKRVIQEDGIYTLAYGHYKLGK